jgi:TonB-dependent SusC/RagA subfamily outer membrane receptor
MKRLSFIFCLFCIFNCASAQDSLHEVIVGAKSTSDAAVKTEGLYVIDGKPVSDVEYKKLNPDDIFEVTLLSDSTATALYGASGANGAVSITTKKLAKKLYQTKLSAFSARYKNYIAKHGDDSNLLYVLNNTMLQIDKKRLRELYDVQPGDIKKVNFKTDSRFKSDATVEIITNDAESE